MDGPPEYDEGDRPLLSLEKEIGSIARHYGNPFSYKVAISAALTVYVENVECSKR